MKSPERIRAVLANRTNADCSEQTVKNNRYHFLLKFEEPVGWDWIETQIQKAKADTETRLELYKIRPSGVANFEIEVREIDRRSGIDDKQNSLYEFEE